MMTKSLPAAALAAALALALTACTSPVDGTSPSPTISSTSVEDAAEIPVVDRDPQGALPTVDFDADGLPSLTAVADDPPSAISVKTLQAGTGASVGQHDFVTVDYAGFLWSDGSQFESSFGTGEPASFLLSDMVEGWMYGLAGTRVGDRVLLVIPPEFGYGDLEDEAIPPDSTLVFVVDVLNSLAITTDELAKATPTGATLPTGLTVSGELGQEPTLSFAADAPRPAEPLTIVIAEGQGPVITENDTLIYHWVGGFWGEEPDSSWPDSFEQLEYGGDEETIGRTVGSRLLLVYPADEESETDAEVIILDLLAVVPGA